MVFRNASSLCCLQPRHSSISIAIGVAAGEGGWDLEDANHYRKK